MKRSAGLRKRPSRIRLMPIVLVAIIGLFALKTLGLMINGGYTLEDKAADRNADRVASAEPADTRSPDRQQSWAQSMFNYPDITGSVGEGGGGKPASEPIPLKISDKPPPAMAGGGAGGAGGDKPMSAGERAILESLSKRRQELDARARELDMRESLLKQAEQRLQAKAGELKEQEAKASTAQQKRDDAENARFKTLVTMYENMKAKDAARIFDRLDMKILMDVASQMNPRRMSDVLAQMSPDAAERLTVELANRAGASGSELPKIEGKPTANAN
ncbi:MAG TPA: flagellar protein FlbB [Pseudolabrys sp.]|nr:flagellar protein FlbB [Pseudolabrys sp.]